MKARENNRSKNSTCVRTQATARWGRLCWCMVCTIASSWRPLLGGMAWGMELSVRIRKSGYCQKMYNCIKCVSQLCFFLQLHFVSCAIFFAVVLISCMIPTYNFAVVPLFLQLYILFPSCAFFFAVVLIYCITTARVTIEKFWARRGWDAGETRARRGWDAGETRARRVRELSQILT
jgi:type IV secretory pathway VirB3-like protein